MSEFDLPHQEVIIAVKVLAHVQGRAALGAAGHGKVLFQAREVLQASEGLR